MYKSSIIILIVAITLACTTYSGLSHTLRVGKCHKVDSNSCIRKEWSKYGVSKCSHVKKYCTSYNKNMHRCCPSTCGVEPICTKSECEKLNGKGTCDSLPDGSSSSSSGSSTVVGSSISSSRLVVVAVVVLAY